MNCGKAGCPELGLVSPGVGRLITPGFFVSALAPLLYALVIERFGDAAALWLSFLLAVGAFVAALVLALRFGPRNRA